MTYIGGLWHTSQALRTAGGTSTVGNKAKVSATLFVAVHESVHGPKRRLAASQPHVRSRGEGDMPR
jgi:hypothetical protein